MRLFEVGCHFRLLHDGRQLVQITEEHETHAAKGLARAPAVDAQRLIDGPHEIGAHHRDFVDDEQLELAHDGAIAAAADVLGPDETRRQAEERVDRLSADVDGGKACRCDDDVLGFDHLAECAQQCRFAGAGASGDEQVAAILAQVVERGLVLGCRSEIGGPLALDAESWRRLLHVVFPGRDVNRHGAGGWRQDRRLPGRASTRRSRHCRIAAGRPRRARSIRP